MKILFIQTGGTIDKDYPRTHAYAFEIGAPAFERILKKVKVNFEIETFTLCRKDSLDMTDEDRIGQKKAITDTDIDKVIVTHGSDTLIETAQFVGNIDHKTCVFLGALSPEVLKETDADFNLGFAIAAVQTLERGTYIAMNGAIMNPTQCRKNKDNGNFEESYE